MNPRKLKETTQQPEPKLYPTLSSNTLTEHYLVLPILRQIGHFPVSYATVASNHLQSKEEFKLNGPEPCYR